MINDTKIVTFNGSYRTREPVESLLKRAREDGPIIEVNAYNYHGFVWVNFATVVALEVVE